ncbi:TetR family transcriptional regulator [Mycolicibacterium flavescens]|uniref:TetR/AcrR family transcriptional regulator n=1 Tax=Mycobacterium neumannii TaxID=2048551 RepID=UPI000B93EDB5|nr:TetR/AcrR family transcriptional regulator [Mycobacterium neumannii]VEG39527.1 TetR family transcriptional regulator [Mycolicibacterium flavescens]
MTALQSDEQVPGAGTRSSVDRIRNAALKCFAARGSSATSLRAVAAEAGVSPGLVQHHFATKANLIKAVDDHVLGVMAEALTQPIPEPPADTIADVGSRVTSLVAGEPDVVAYVGRALTDGSSLGAQLFDSLAAIGAERWRVRAEQGLTRPDLDPIWGTLNPLVLALGAWVLRAHIERHLPEPLETPEQLQRWQNATDSLLRDGQMRHDS